MKVAVRYGNVDRVAAREDGRRTGRLRGAAQGSRARPRRLEGSALHQARDRRPLGAGDSAAAQGSLHRRLRSREPGARRVLEKRTSRFSRCWPARRRWRSRTRGCTRRFAPTKSGWRRKSGSPSACRRRCCRPTCPKRLKGVDVAARFAPARELGGDLYDFLMPEPNSLVVAVGDVSGKGVPAALYSAFAGELVRSRTFRRRYTPDRSSPAGVLASMNTILYQRQLEEYYCTLCYAMFDFKRRTVVMANSGLPYPIRCRHGDRAVTVLRARGRSSCRACRSDRFPDRPTTR